MKKAKTVHTVVGRISEDALEFTAGRDILLDMLLLPYDCAGTAAHVIMLTNLSSPERIFTRSECRKVLKELSRIVRMGYEGSFQITEEDQDIHMAVERVLISRLGELGARVHTGRSRNDQVATDIRLYTKELLLEVMEVTADLARELTNFGRRYQNVPMVGRTHMQPAMLSTVGLWASAYAESLIDDLICVRSAYDFNNKSPLGSAAGFGVPLHLKRDITAGLLGFEAPLHNVFHAANTRGKCESVVLSAVIQPMLTLSRLVEDLIIYSTPEFGYFSLPQEYCTGSSIMPQKKNPDVLELVRARTSVMIGYLCSVMSIVKALPGGYNRDLQETKGPLLDGIQIVLSCLKIMKPIISGLRVDKNKLVAGFTPEIFAADYALEQVKKGIPFRNAYHEVKSKLEQVQMPELREALKRRSYPGAPGAPEIEVLEKRAVETIKFVRSERRKFFGCISRLLGIRFRGTTTYKK
jgi:argininosuccinate lyase